MRINDVKIPEFSWLLAKNGGELYIKDIAVSNFRTTGNIAPTAKEDGIVYSYSTANQNNVFNNDGELHFWTHINSRNNMIFDADYIKIIYASGLTHITLTFYMGSSFTTETWSTAYFGYMDPNSDSSVISYFMDGDTKLGGIDIRKKNVGEENAVTVEFDLTQTLYEMIDFDNGYTFVLGNLLAGSNNPLKMIITHLEFSTPKS